MMTVNEYASFLLLSADNCGFDGLCEGQKRGSSAVECSLFSPPLFFSLDDVSLFGLLKKIERIKCVLKGKLDIALKKG